MAFRNCITLLVAVLALASTVATQSFLPSNNTSDIPSYDRYPRFWVNASDVTSFRVVPVGWYSSISQQAFQNIRVNGRLLHVNSGNTQSLLSDGIDYISCDASDYPGVLGAADIVRIIASSQTGNSIILYSRTSNHCLASSSLPSVNGIFTTTDPMLAATVLGQIQNVTNGQPAAITPDANSYTLPNGYNNNNNNPSSSSNGPRPGPTTAVAMVILYTITGLITALFVIIIVTGATRAHRHPERYGPSNIGGRPRRSRAKGLARAMLETIPIVKFGEKEETAKKDDDVEMNAVTDTASQDKSKSATDLSEADTDTVSGAVPVTKSVNADGADEAGTLGCSICTEDFNKGEEVRVLPCNHKFHPECVDPWLLNVSGTCPLCRIDLRPKEEQTQAATEDEVSAETSRQGLASHRARRPSHIALDFIAPPLQGLPLRSDRDQRSRRDTATFAGLRSVATGSREDRIAALRRLRQQRRGQSETAEQEEERRGLATRLRERFRIRTRRQGEDDVNFTNTEARPPFPGVPVSMLPSHN